MPYLYEWVEPAIFVECNNIKVYFTYQHDNIKNQTSDYNYTTDKYYTNYKNPYHGHSMFDVRDLPNWVEDSHPPYLDFAKMGKEKFKKTESEWNIYHEKNSLEKHIRKIVEEAIKAGYIPVLQE